MTYDHQCRIYCQLFYSVIRITTPLLFGAMGALICKQAACCTLPLRPVCCSLRPSSAWLLLPAFTQSLWVGLLAGMVGGVLLMLAPGLLHLKLDANITLTGIALNTPFSGGTRVPDVPDVRREGASTSLPSLVFPNIDIP